MDQMNRTNLCDGGMQDRGICLFWSRVNPRGRKGLAAAAAAVPAVVVVAVSIVVIVEGPA